MTARTTPELLRAAATRLREVAGKVEPGPWIVHGFDVFSPEAAEIAACWGVETAPFIATMDPTVATALADLLDELVESDNWTQPIAELECIALARAVLKEPQ